MKYIVHRDMQGQITLVSQSQSVGKGEVKTREIGPARSQEIWNHSPDGFNFGYGGSGPSQLALAIVLDFTHDPAMTRRNYHAFKEKFLVNMEHPGGEILGRIIERWIKKREEEK